MENLEKEVREVILEDIAINGFASYDMTEEEVAMVAEQTTEGTAFIETVLSKVLSVLAEKGDYSDNAIDSAIGAVMLDKDEFSEMIFTLRIA